MDIRSLAAAAKSSFCASGNSACIPLDAVRLSGASLIPSPSTTAGRAASTSGYTAGAFWERLWRSAGIQSLGLFIIGYVIYGYQPHVGASADALTAFYDGDRTRILIAAVFFGLSILNLLWFAAALRATLAAARQDGSAAAVARSTAAAGR